MAGVDGQALRSRRWLGVHALPRRLVHLIPSVDRGGAELSLVRLLARTDRRRFEPVVVTLLRPGALEDSIRALNVDIHAVGMQRRAGAVAQLPRLRKILRGLAPDVVHCWMYHANALASLLWRTVGKPRIVWNLHHSRLDPALEHRTTIAIAKGCRFLTRRVSSIAACSRTGLEMHRRLGYPRDKLVFVPNGYDTSVFQPDQLARNRIRTELGIRDDVLLVGITGRYHPYKGHEDFLKMARLVSNELPGSLFLMCGRDVTAENGELGDRILEIGLQGRVRLLGERDDIPHVMAALDVAVSSSLVEAFPNAVAEAMACGLPCAVTDVGDSAFLVGNRALVSPVGDFGAQAKIVSDLLRLPSHARLQLGDTLRERIRGQFSIERMVHAFEAIYEGASPGWP